MDCKGMGKERAQKNRQGRRQSPERTVEVKGARLFSSMMRLLQLGRILQVSLYFDGLWHFRHLGRGDVQRQKSDGGLFYDEWQNRSAVGVRLLAITLILVLLSGFVFFQLWARVTIST